MTNERTARNLPARTAPVAAPVAALCAGVALVCGALQLDPVTAAPGTGPVSSLVPDFSALDTDGDGAMSEKEWMASDPASMMSADMAAAHFAMYDADGDDSVSAAEYGQVNAEALGERQSDPI